MSFLVLHLEPMVDFDLIFVYKCEVWIEVKCLRMDVSVFLAPFVEFCIEFSCTSLKITWLDMCIYVYKSMSRLCSALLINIYFVQNPKLFQLLDI